MKTNPANELERALRVQDERLMDELRNKFAREIWIGVAYPNQRDGRDAERVWRSQIELPYCIDDRVAAAFKTADRIIAELRSGLVQREPDTADKVRQLNALADWYDNATVSFAVQLRPQYTWHYTPGYLLRAIAIAESSAPVDAVSRQVSGEDHAMVATKGPETVAVEPAQETDA